MNMKKIGAIMAAGMFSGMFSGFTLAGPVELQYIVIWKKILFPNGNR